MLIMRKLLVKNLIFTVLLALVSFILFNTVLTVYYIPVFWYLLLGMATITSIIHLVLLKLTHSNISRFSNRFILITGIRMIVFLALITSYSFIFPQQAVSFLISFLTLYVLYSGFEVVLIIPLLKENRKNN